MKIGLIGYGNIAKKHVASLASETEHEIIAIHDLVQPAESPFPFYTDIKDFFAADTDLVTICSPNGLHAAHTIQALKHGKHVICEKPLSLTKDDCARMVAAAQQADRGLFCTMQNRYSPVSQWLRGLVDNQALGDIYLVNVACYWNRNKNYYKGSAWRGSQAADGGTLFTQFSHYVDTIYWLLGDIEVLNAHLKNYDHDDMIEFEDTGIFNFKLAKGGMGTFSYTTSCYEKNFESSMTLIGSKGTVKISGQYMDRVEYCNVQDIEPPTLPANDNLANIRSVYNNSIAHINRDLASNTSPLEAMKVVELIEKVYSFR